MNKLIRAALLLLGGGLVGAACSGDAPARADGGDCLCYRPPVIETAPCVNDTPNASGSIAWAVLSVPGATPYDLLDVQAVGALVPDAPTDRPDLSYGRSTAPVLIGEGFAAVACDRRSPTFAHLFSEVTFIRPAWHQH